jgi:cellulose synthase operon protein C
MILLFPNDDALRLALSSGLVPVATPASASRDAAGRVFVETNAKIPERNRADLKKLGILGSTRHGGPIAPHATWLSIVPLETVSGPSPATPQTPVLFELPAKRLPAIAGEMIRLGNDRQVYRLLEREGESRALLRVVGPPYYTLLRALDRLDGDAGLRAFVEHAPRVWIEIGSHHPFAGRIEPATGQIVLIGRPDEWRYLDDGDFRDVYDLVDFQMPNVPADWKEGMTPERLVVPLKLVAGNTMDAAELWVLRGQSIAGLEAFVRGADARLLELLRFAVGVSAIGETIVVVTAASTRKAPPVLAIPGAESHKSYWRIPNLFVPVGTRLHPPLRRDVVTRLLASDSDRRVWLAPGNGGAFTPESIAENAFRPLGDWVEYVIDSNAVELREWIASAEFDFEGFVCADGAPTSKAERTRTAKDMPGEDIKDAPAAKGARKAPARKAPAKDLHPFEPVAVAVRPPDEWKIRCDELERRFREADGLLDSTERTALWPLLAEANAGMGEDRRGEAAICWLNAMWNDPTPSPESLAGWLTCETPNPIVSPGEFDLRFGLTGPTPGQARAAVALFLSAAHANPLPDWLRSRLPVVPRYLEAHESRIPVRAVWLAAVRSAQLARGDALGLARVRDRLLNRLLEKGLSAEQDLPSFLRFAGVKNSERMRVVRERMVEIHRAARTWAETSLKPGASNPSQPDSTCTLAYLDLFFAFGLAKLGEPTPAQALVEQARVSLAAPKPKPEQAIVANYLFQAFKSRVDEALAGKPGTGPTSRELLDELEAIRKKGAKTLNDPHTFAHYAIGRMREQSTILEPREKSDPYSEWMKLEELIQELVALPRIADTAALARRIRDLYKSGLKGTATDETRLAVLSHSLRLAPRVGADFTAELLQHVLAAMKVADPKSALATMETRKLGRYFESALFLAAHFDRRELLRELVDGVIAVALAKPDDQRYELVNFFAGRCLASLRKVGLRDEIDRLLLRFQDEILKGRTLDQLKTLHGTKPDLWADALTTMLNLSAGWLTFGLVEQAAPILETARAEIHDGTRCSVQRYVNVCRAYAAALGLSPADFGIPRIAELFSIIEPKRVTNTFSSSSYYSRFHLNLIEDVVLAIVNDDFALGHSGQRWLDEDELLVRRRIHRDMRAAAQDAGV